MSRTHDPIAPALLASLRGQRIYVDTNFFIYFLAGHAPYAAALAPLFAACGEREILGVTGDAVVAELLVKPLRLQDQHALAQIKQLFEAEPYFERVPHDYACFVQAAHLRAEHGLKMLDALHYATALRSGCSAMLSNDQAFGKVGTLQVFGPAAFMTLAAHG